MKSFLHVTSYHYEQNLKVHFNLEWDEQGINCKKCQGREHYWKYDKWTKECKISKFRTGCRSGTIIQSSNLLFLVWYRVMFLKSKIKKGFSAKGLDLQKTDEVDKLLNESIQNRTFIFTDKFTYVEISNYVDMNLRKKYYKAFTKVTHSWIHIFISNATTDIISYYYKIKGKYLNINLIDFFYKPNCGYFGEKSLIDKL